MPEAINQCAMDNNGYILNAITNSSMQVETNDVAATFQRTLARDQKLGIYFRLDFPLPEEVFSPTKRPDFKKLLHWSLNNADKFVVTRGV